jgi:hypothetical protein
MSSPAQINANIANLPASTGPRTEAGLAISSKNAISHGLFTAADFIRPGEEQIYGELNTALMDELAPNGILEQNLAAEIRRAMWRLRRCGEVEGHLVIGVDAGTGYIFDPMETTNAAAEKVQKSVDRARAHAHRLLHKCTAELRRLQTDRRKTSKLPLQHDSGGSSAPIIPITKRTPPETANSAEIARSAPCPCKSGLKYKRCCGRNAPAILHAA